MARAGGFLTVFFLCMAATSTVWAQDVKQVGLSEIRIERHDSMRNLDVCIWYPTTATAKPRLMDDNAVFIGVQATPDVDVADGEFPLVILSHGLGGGRSNLSWLAVHLAAGGMIAATLNHPGTTRGDMASPQTRKPWERARDISGVITFLTAHPRFGARVKTSRIAVIGHSLGGNTAMALAGARFDVERFVSDCDAYPGDHDCHWYLEHAIDHDPSSINQVQQSLKDERVTAAVGLDVGFARGFTPESLSGISIPILLVESGRHVAGRPRGWYSQYLAASLRPAATTYLEIADAGHFSFITECKPGALDILKSEGRGDEVVCMDGNSRTRADLHAEIALQIDRFLRGAGF